MKKGIGYLLWAILIVFIAIQFVPFWRSLKSRFIDKLIEKVDRIEPGEMQQYLIQLVQEKGIFVKVFEALELRSQPAFAGGIDH